MNTKNKKIKKYAPAEIKLYIICAILMATTFIIDLQIPLGVAGAVPYVFVILISLWSQKPNTRLVISLVVACTFLTLLGFYFSPSGGELWKIIFNRVLAIFAIWITATLTLKWKIHEQVVFDIKSKMEKEKEEIYLATIHGAQHITNNLLNELKLVELEIEKHPDFDKEISAMFSDMLTEANDLIHELSSVDEINEQSIRQSVHPKKTA